MHSEHNSRPHLEQSRLSTIPAFCSECSAATSLAMLSDRTVTAETRLISLEEA